MSEEKKYTVEIGGKSYDIEEEVYVLLTSTMKSLSIQMRRNEEKGSCETCEEWHGDEQHVKDKSGLPLHIKTDLCNSGAMMGSLLSDKPVRTTELFSCPFYTEGKTCGSC